jgi:hypothetical protein
MGHKDIFGGHKEAPERYIQQRRCLPDFVETSDQTPNEPPKVELKPISTMLHYEFLSPNETYLMIITTNLNEDQTQTFL